MKKEFVKKGKKSFTSKVGQTTRTDNESFLFDKARQVKKERKR